MPQVTFPPHRSQPSLATSPTPAQTTMAERYIPEHRRSNFKAKGTFKQDELRRRREEQQVEIRKQKRDENLAKRRNLAVNSPPPGTTGDSDEESAVENQVSLLPHFIPAFCCFRPSHLLLLREGQKPENISSWRPSDHAYTK